MAEAAATWELGRKLGLSASDTDEEVKAWITKMVRKENKANKKGKKSRSSSKKL